MPRVHPKRFTSRLSSWYRHCCNETYRSTYLFSRRSSETLSFLSWGFWSSIGLFFPFAFPCFYKLLVCLPGINVIICQGIAHLDEFHLLMMAFKDCTTTFIASNLY